MTRLLLNPVGGYVVAGICAFVLVAIVCAVPSSKWMATKQRLVLIGLRVLLSVLISFAMFRPTLVHSVETKQRPGLVFLIDQSRSMLVADELAGKSRWDALSQAVETIRPDLAELDEDFDVRLYTFGSELSALSRPGNSSLSELPEEPDQRQTAIGAVLDDVIRREGSRRLAGVVLFSDGAQKAYSPRDLPPQASARRLRELACPLFTVPFGQARSPGKSRDIAVTNLLTSPSVFVKNVLSVDASARIFGFTNEEIAGQLLFEKQPGEMAVVATEVLQSQTDGDRIPLQLKHTPEVPGEFKLTVRLPPQPSELITTNNELSTFVTVRPEGLKILFLEGTPRPEALFLTRSLDTSADIRVDSRWIAGKDRRQSWPVAIFAISAVSEYDVFVFGDIDSTAFSEEDLQAIRDRVEQGAGLLMVGGRQTFGPGGYDATPLADLVPVELSRFDRQQPDEPTARPDVHLSGPVKMQPVSSPALAGFVTRLRPGDANDSLWNELPRMEGANKFGPLKRTAAVIAETPQGQPLLVAQEFGLGRVLAFAGDSTWRWVMQGHDEAHRRFWRQVVLWLARRDQRTDGNVWIELTQRRFAPTSRVSFYAGVESAERTPIVDADMRAEVELPDGSRDQVPLVREGDRFSGLFLNTLAPGDYSIHVSASKSGQELGQATIRFLVFDQDLELDNPAADPTLLAMLSEITEDAGGRVVLPEELPELLEDFQNRPPQYDVEIQSRMSLWDNWPFFLLVIAVFGLDWYLRKRWGLA